MISKLSTMFADKLLMKQGISEDERELYIYGYFILISHLLYLVLASLFGLLFNCFLESIIFYIAFQFIRRTAGGYHASTETRCQIISTISIFASIALINILKIYNSKIFLLLILTAVSTTIIFVLSPLDTDEKPLSAKEFNHFRKKARIIVLTIFFIIVVTYYLNLNFICTPCCISLILESILLISGKIKKQYKIFDNFATKFDNIN